jgi:hypothetical protein
MDSESSAARWKHNVGTLQLQRRMLTSCFRIEVYSGCNEKNRMEEKNIVIRNNDNLSAVVIGDSSQSCECDPRERQHRLYSVFPKPALE